MGTSNNYSIEKALKELKEDWEPFNWKDLDGDTLVTTVITDKRFEPIFSRNQKESLNRNHVRIVAHTLNGVVVKGKISDIIKVCDECRVGNPNKILK